MYSGCEPTVYPVLRCSQGKNWNTSGLSKRKESDSFSFIFVRIVRAEACESFFFVGYNFHYGVFVSLAPSLMVSKQAK